MPPSSDAATVVAMPLGRKVLALVAGATAVGGFAADWNRTHLFNPRWPPHAKFHDAQTIVLGTMLGGSGLYFLHRGRGRHDTALAAALPAFFWAAQGASFAFPGAAGLEAEFPDLVPRVRGVWINERFASGPMLALAALGYGLERARVARNVPHTG